MRDDVRGEVLPAEVVDDDDDLANERAWQVFKLHAAGVPKREIGRRLGLAEGTVRYHVRRVLERAGPHPLVGEYVARQLAELQLVRERLLEVALLEVDTVKLAAVVAALDRLHVSERHLTGVDRLPSPAEAVRRMTEEEIARKLDAFLAERAARGAEEALPAAVG